MINVKIRKYANFKMKNVLKKIFAALLTINHQLLIENGMTVKNSLSSKHSFLVCFE